MVLAVVAVAAGGGSVGLPGPVIRAGEEASDGIGGGGGGNADGGEGQAGHTGQPDGPPPGPRPASTGAVRFVFVVLMVHAASPVTDEQPAIRGSSGGGPRLPGGR
nr:hypothetical protein [Salinispora cortesiana]